LSLDQIISPKFENIDNKHGVDDLRTPFEIYVLCCHGKKKNQWSNLPAAKVVFFNTRSKKALKTTCFNEKSIDRENNKPDATNRYKNGKDRVYYDFYDEICFLKHIFGIDLAKKESGEEIITRFCPESPLPRKIGKN